MILGRLWIEKHGILLDMIKDYITFSPGYCIHLGALSSPITLKSQRIEIMPKVNYEDLTPKRILQSGIDENLDDFLSRNIKLFLKKKTIT